MARIGRATELDEGAQALYVRVGDGCFMYLMLLNLARDMELALLLLPPWDEASTSSYDMGKDDC